MFYGVPCIVEYYIYLHKSPKRRNGISFLRLFVFSRCTSRQNEEIWISFLRLFVLSRWSRRQNEQKRKRRNGISFLRLFVLSRCTSRHNKEMEFHFFVCSFCRVGQGAKTNKSENEISKFLYLRLFVLSRRTSRQNKEMDFISSFVRFVAFPTVRRNDKVTTKYQSLICRGYLFVLSFVRFVDFHKAPKWQNNNATKWGLYGNVYVPPLVALWGVNALKWKSTCRGNVD